MYTSTFNGSSLANDANVRENRNSLGSSYHTLKDGHLITATFVGKVSTDEGPSKVLRGSWSGRSGRLDTYFWLKIQNGERVYHVCQSASPLLLS